VPGDVYFRTATELGDAGIEDRKWHQLYYRGSSRSRGKASVLPLGEGPL